MNTHKHKCFERGCGAVWRHGDECLGSDEAHKCPDCGVINTWKYHGSEEPRDKERGIKPVPMPEGEEGEILF